MKKYVLTIPLLLGAVFLAAPAFSEAPLVNPDGSLTLKVAQSRSCNPRRTCSKIRTCADAYWYWQNCNWGGRLDGDNDGVPCESICR